MNKENIYDEKDAGDFEYKGDNEYDYDLRREELKRNPNMKKDILFNDIPIDKKNSAQEINVFNKVNRYGKLATLTLGNSNICRNIVRLKPINFGNISEMDIGALPHTLMSRMGVEKTFITQRHKSYKGIDLISRRFASKVISNWSYIYGIRYIRGKNPKKWKQTGVMLNCFTDSLLKDMYLTTGNKIKELILEIIKEVRANNPKCFYNFSMKLDNLDDANEIQYSIIYKRVFPNKKGDILEEKIIPINRWKIPRYNMEYLFGCLKKLNSGNYYMDTPIPIIKDMWKYPIKCTDMHTIKSEYRKDKNENKVYRVNDKAGDYDSSIYNTDERLY